MTGGSMTSGPMTGTAPVPAPVAWLLAPLGRLYALTMIGRAALYRWGLLRARRLSVPVVSVGNLTAGGAGKTPVAAALAAEAARAGLRPVVISRGYRRRGRSTLIRVCAAEGVPADAESIGDEPLWLARRNPALPVYIGRKRHAAGRLAETLDRPQLILLDDGFQHLALARDLDLVLVDAERGLGNGKLLPGGYLREPLGALRRADAVIISKANLGPADSLHKKLSQAVNRGQNGGIPIFRFDYVPARLTRLDGGGACPLEALQGQSLSLVCAIGRPEGFAVAVRAAGAEVERMIVRRDHDPYGPAALAHLDAAMGQVEAGRPVWLTTEKDAVKLQDRLVRPERMWVLEMEVRPGPDWEQFFTDFLGRTAPI